MTELEKYELVNKCETDKELSEAIMMLSDPEIKLIQGRNSAFDAVSMAENCYCVINKNMNPNTLTRQYGIRQQALYIRYYISND